MLLPKKQQSMQHGAADLPQPGCLATHIVLCVVFCPLLKEILQLAVLVGFTASDLRPLGCCGASHVAALDSCEEDLLSLISKRYALLASEQP